jgi:hypothetical protein
MRVTVVRGLAAVPLALALALLPGVAPGIALACSCVGFDDPVAETAADPMTVVFTGVAEIPRPDGNVPIQLTRWFKGAAPATPVVLLDGQGFQDPMGGSCGTHAPPPGQEWIFVTAMAEPSIYGINMCTPHGPVDEAGGAQLLRAAVARYGPGTGIVSESAPAATIAAGISPEIVLAATFGAAGLIFLLTLAAWRRSRADDGAPRP